MCVRACVRVRACVCVRGYVCVHRQRLCLSNDDIFFKTQIRPCRFYCFNAVSDGIAESWTLSWRKKIVITTRVVSDLAPSDTPNIT